MFSLCYLWQVFICLYHNYGSGSLSLFQSYLFLQVQHELIASAAGLIHLGNASQDDNDVLLPIGWSVVLGTVHPKYTDFSFHRLTVQQIDAVGGVLYVLEPLLLVHQFYGFLQEDLCSVYFLRKWGPSTSTGEVSRSSQDIFATIIIMTSYNLRDYFPLSIILITFPIFRRWCWDKQSYYVGQYWRIVNITQGKENIQENIFWSGIREICMRSRRF